MSLIILAGHYGVGKTTLALNMARAMSKAHLDVSLIDLDLVNPYYRSGDYSSWCEEQGIALLTPCFAGTTLDTPAISGAIVTQALAAQQDPSKAVIVDLGGSDVGARVWGSIQPLLAPDKILAIYVVNLMRDFNSSTEELREDIQAIEDAARIQFPCMLNNSHLCGDTTLEIIHQCDCKAQSIAHDLSKRYLGSTIEETLLGEQNLSTAELRSLSDLVTRAQNCSSNPAQGGNASEQKDAVNFAKTHNPDAQSIFFPIEQAVLHPWSL